MGQQPTKPFDPNEFAKPFDPMEFASPTVGQQEDDRSGIGRALDWFNTGPNKALLDYYQDPEVYSQVSEWLDPIAQRHEGAKIPEWIPGVGGGTWRSLGVGALEGLMRSGAEATRPTSIVSLGAGKVGQSLAGSANQIFGQSMRTGGIVPRVAGQISQDAQIAAAAARAAPSIRTARQLEVASRVAGIPGTLSSGREVAEGIRTGDYTRAAAAVPGVVGGIAAVTRLPRLQYETRLPPPPAPGPAGARPVGRGTSPAAAATAPENAAGIPKITLKPEIVIRPDMHSAAMNAWLKTNGYVFTGKRAPDGSPIATKRELAGPEFQTQEPVPPAEPPPISMGPGRPPVKQGTRTIRDKSTIKITNPNEKAIASLLQQGYRISNVEPGGVTTFSLIPAETPTPPPAVVNEFTPQEPPAPPIEPEPPRNIMEPPGLPEQGGGIPGILGEFEQIPTAPLPTTPIDELRAQQGGVYPRRPGVNPLRPDIPVGQVTNQQMGDVLRQRAAQEAIPTELPLQGPELPAEFQPDIPLQEEPPLPPDIIPERPFPTPEEQLENQLPWEGPDPTLPDLTMLDDVGLQQLYDERTRMAETSPPEEQAALQQQLLDIEAEYNNRYLQGGQAVEPEGMRQINEPLFDFDPNLPPIEGEILPDDIAGMRAIERERRRMTEPQPYGEGFVIYPKGYVGEYQGKFVQQLPDGSVIFDAGRDVFDRQGPEPIEGDVMGTDIARAAEGVGTNEQRLQDAFLENINRYIHDPTTPSEEIEGLIQHFNQQSMDLPDDSPLHRVIDQITLWASDELMRRRQSGEDGPREGIDFARLPSGKAIVSSDTTRQAKELTTGYSGALPGIMVREAMQNALDAVEGFTNGEVSVTIRRDGKNNKIIITDNGIGLTPEQMFTVYIDLHSSGKGEDPAKRGGKGVGKAPYMMGGAYFKVTSVADVNGQKIQSSFEGEPNSFLVEPGFDIKSEGVDPDTPTGTVIETTLAPDQDEWSARNMTDKFIKWSRDSPAKITMNTYGWNPEVIEPKYLADDKIVASEKVAHGNADIDIVIPKGEATGTHSIVMIHVLNRGMYQFSKDMSLTEESNGVPGNIIVNVKSNVVTGHPDYPFPIQRESIKEPIWKEIEQWVTDRLISPLAKGRKYDLVKIWDAMQKFRVTKAHRETVMFDVSTKFTPGEANHIRTSRTMVQLAREIDDIIHNILLETGYTDWYNKVVRTGFIFEESSLYGIHINHPSNKNQSAILVNPFAHAGNQPLNPFQAALDTIVTALHEVGHVGNQDVRNAELTPEDLNDPRVGQYLQTYLTQAMQQGGINMGHGMAWLHRTGLAYAKYGTRRAIEAADRIAEIISDPTTGGYSREFQELLQIYQDSRGRSGTTEDLLTPTGIKQADTGQRGANIGGGNYPPDGGGTTGGQSGGLSRGQKFREWYNLARGSTTVWDISAPGRQGAPLVFSREWLSSWGPQWRSLKSQAEFDAAQEGLRDIETNTGFQLFAEEFNEETGRFGPSWAEQRGFHFTDTAELNNREETIASNWVETGEMFGQGTLAQRGYAATYGRGARASNRAYTAFLNNLRATTITKLINEAYKIYETARDTGKAKRGFLFSEKFTPEQAEQLNPYTNDVYARQIIDFVMTATGRGPLKTQLPFGEGKASFFGKEVNLPFQERSIEQFAKPLSYVLFSPRLWASRSRMLNPMTYVMADPFVRKQYLKALMSVAASWGTIAFLSTLLGAEVETAITSADFGKPRWGNIRMDPGQGFQQYLVAAMRLLSGGGKPATGGEEYTTGKGYRAETERSVFQRFVVNKLHPVLKFAYDMGDASERQPFYVGDRIAQLYVSLIFQDMVQVAKEDPTLLPLMAPASAVGLGTQTYSKGEEESVLIPKDWDFKYVGGGPPEIFNKLMNIF